MITNTIRDADGASAGRKHRLILLGVDALSLLLLRRFVAEGALPTFRRLLAEGAALDVAPCLPCHTPTNWATISTGAWTGTHGAANWYGQRAGDHLRELPPHVWRSGGITAETLWEAAERAGRTCLLLRFPGTWPPTIRHGVVVPLTPGVGPQVLLRRGEVYDLVHAATVLDGNTASGGSSRRGICDLPAAEPTAATPGDWAVELEVPGEAPPGQAMEAPLPWRFEDTPAVVAQTASQTSAGAETVPDGLRIRVRVAAGVVTLEPLVGEGPVGRLRPGAWSGWYAGRFAGPPGVVRAACRFKLAELRDGGRAVRLVRSAVSSLEGPSSPAGLAAALTRHAGPYLVGQAVPLRPDSPPEDVEMALEEYGYRARWYVEAMRFLTQQGPWKNSWDLCCLYVEWVDTMIHRFLPLCDRQSPAYDRARAPLALDALRRSLELVDSLLAGLLELANEQTYVCVISDHGNAAQQWLAHPASRLEECGLLVLRDGQIDWEQTRVYPHGPLQVCVNLRGRDRYGWVAPEDYERVQEEVIDALLTWKEPETRRRPIALALKKRDAHLLGFWGDRTGDVIYLFNQGFSYEKPVAGSIGPATGGANHAPQPPAARSELSSNLATLLAWGPGVRAGYARDPERLGLARLVDVVPTICHLLGIRPPAQSQGAVLYDLLGS